MMIMNTGKTYPALPKYRSSVPDTHSVITGHASG